MSLEEEVIKDLGDISILREFGYALNDCNVILYRDSAMQLREVREQGAMKVTHLYLGSKEQINEQHLQLYNKYNAIFDYETYGELYGLS